MRIRTQEDEAAERLSKIPSQNIDLYFVIVIGRCGELRPSLFVGVEVI